MHAVGLRSIVLVSVFTTISAVQIIPERPGVQYVNPAYLEWLNITVTRFGRRSPYYLNIEVHIINKSLGNNITLHVLSFEYLSNEYRRSFMEVHTPLCKLFPKNDVIGSLINTGVGPKICPVPVGVHRHMNMTTPGLMKKVRWPFKRARFDITFAVTATNETVAKAFIHYTIT